MTPKAQTRGSARADSGLSLFAANMPISTPENPARQVIMPNIKLTLQHTHTQTCSTYQTQKYHSSMVAVI